MQELISDARMEVHPSVLFRLGEELITDEVQAVAELIKNSYDADATYAIVRIATDDSPSEHPSDRGYVSIVDDGHGMTIDEIRAGWLTVSNSLKKRMKIANQTTPGGRTPLGDKGLGRLGAQRLGNRLSIVTTPPESKVTYQLSFNWRDFDKFDQLSGLKLSIYAVPRLSEGQGTTITISDLRDPESLRNVAEMQKALAKIVSPYRGVSGFRLVASLNGETLDLHQYEDSLRRAAVIHYDLVFDDDQLQIDGHMRLNFLRPSKKLEREFFDDVCQRDGGSSLLAFLQERPEGQDYHFQASAHKGWWAQFRLSIGLGELSPALVTEGDDVQQAPRPASSRPPKTRPTIASPGPFFGEIDAYNLRSNVLEDLADSYAPSVVRQHVKELAGIRIYRDGFNIRTEADWLELGRSWTSGGSWYGLRPGTTLGYIELSAQDNPLLIETTDRERFSQTPHYENFRLLLTKFVEFTHKVQEFVGRATVDFRHKMLATDADRESTTPQDAATRLSETLADAKMYRSTLMEIRHSLTEGIDQIDKVAAALDSQRERDGDDADVLMATLSRLQNAASEAIASTTMVTKFIEDLEKQATVGDQLQAEIDVLEQQIEVAYETMGIGIVAEALTHEITNIADRLAQHTNHIYTYVRKNHSKDQQLLSYISQVRSSILGLRVQVAHLAPAYRYVRDVREQFSLSSLLEDSREYFLSRWHDQSLTIDLQIESDVSLYVNRGRIMQVLDNLLLNSEYWLREAIRLGEIAIGVVTIAVDGGTIIFTDNGPGVSPEIENSLFAAFTSRKPKGVGRGLGLFIATQLLEAEGCTIRLSHARNSKGRRHEFVVDLNSIVHQPSADGSDGE